MTKTVNTLSVKLRTRAGKGAARAERREGYIPGVIYGDNKPLVMFSVADLDLARELRKPGFRTRIYEIDVEGEKHHAICQDIQRDLILNRPVHIDFLRINKTAEIRLEIPLVFVGEEACPGIKQGGVANIVVREIPMLCRQDSIPEHIEIDLSALQLGDTIHLADVKLPDGIRSAEEDNPTLVAIHAPAAEKEEAAPAAEEAAADGAAAPAAAGTAASDKAAEAKK